VRGSARGHDPEAGFGDTKKRGVDSLTRLFGRQYVRPTVPAIPTCGPALVIGTFPPAEGPLGGDWWLTPTRGLESEAGVVLPSADDVRGPTLHGCTGFGRVYSLGHVRTERSEPGWLSAPVTEAVGRLIRERLHGRRLRRYARGVGPRPPRRGSNEDGPLRRGPRKGPRAAVPTIGKPVERPRERCFVEGQTGFGHRDPRVKAGKVAGRFSARRPGKPERGPKAPPQGANRRARPTVRGTISIRWSPGTKRRDLVFLSRVPGVPRPELDAALEGT